MKRSRSRSGPTSELYLLFPENAHPLRVFVAQCRDAIISFGAGYGVLQVPVERRITQYLQQERLFAVGDYETFDGLRGCEQTRCQTRVCFSYEVSFFGWEEERSDMLECRSDFGLVVFRGELWAVGGLGDNPWKGSLRSCERLDARSSEWLLGPFFAVAVLDGAVWPRQREGFVVL